MRKTFIYTLFSVAMTAVAAAGEIYPAGEPLAKMSSPKSKRHASLAGGLNPHHVSRDSSDGFIPSTPSTKGIPVVGANKHGGKRRRLRRDEVVVPATLQDHASKRAPSCGDASYGLCPNQDMCCPIDGLCCKSGDCCPGGYRCCTVGGCCPDTHDCVTVNDIHGCCPKGKICNSNSTNCGDPGFVHCPNMSFCCRVGETCSLDASGKASCVPPSSNQATTTTTTKGPATTATTTTAPAVTTTTTTPAEVQTTTTTTPQPTTTTTPEAKVQETTSTTDQQLPTTMVQSSIAAPLGGGPPTTMYNPTAITTLPNAASASTPAASNVDIPIGNTSGAMAITAGIGYSVLVTAVSFALGHVVVMA